MSHSSARRQENAFAAMLINLSNGGTAAVRVQHSIAALCSYGTYMNDLLSGADCDTIIIVLHCSLVCI